MFVTITRTGSARELRVLATAIAYVDEAEGCTLVKLTSGEALRASEDRATLEKRIDKAVCGDLIVGELLQTDPDPLVAAAIERNRPPKSKRQ